MASAVPGLNNGIKLAFPLLAPGHAGMRLEEPALRRMQQSVPLPCVAQQPEHPHTSACRKCRFALCAVYHVPPCRVLCIHHPFGPQVPVTFIYGEHDWMNPAAGVTVAERLDAIRARKTTSDHKVELVPNSGHVSGGRTRVAGWVVGLDGCLAVWLF